MIKNLAPEEEYKAKYVLEYGIEKTANALGSMLNKEVSALRVELKKYEDWVNLELEYGRTNTDHIIMLKTELVGGVAGINYFLLSESEMKTIGKACLPEDLVKESSSSAANFLVEFLKEIENVLAAATISEISDKLKTDLFGDVPKIQAIHADRVNQIIERETYGLHPSLVLHCHMHVPELAISPDFLWFFNAAFLEKLKSLSESELLENVLIEK
ncbi:hypothetical protein [Reichenbachiella sp.]|uniref:hypothetical protein n=1 Tax=Reichenbachiella sp. TaxID=2184521 RepID=UPI003298F5B1